MSDLPPDEIQLARERLQRSREQLHRAFRGGAVEGRSGSATLMQTMLVKGVQLLLSGRGGPLGAIGPLFSLATMVLPLLLRRRTRSPATGLLGPLAIAALALLRRRQRRRLT